MADMLRAQQAFPGLSDLVEELAPKWSGLPQIDLPELRFRLIIGDARLEVRRRLQTVGFTVERTSGFGRERHMTRARRET